MAYTEEEHELKQKKRYESLCKIVAILIIVLICVILVAMFLGAIALVKFLVCFIVGLSMWV